MHWEGKKYHKDQIKLANLSILHMREIEEKIDNIIARLAYMGSVNHQHDFDLLPKICIHLNLLIPQKG